MDGVRTASSLSISLSSLLSSGLSIYQDYIYWADTQVRTLRAVNRTTGTPVLQVSQRFSRTTFGGVEVVHPSKQPAGKQLDPPSPPLPLLPQTKWVHNTTGKLILWLDVEVVGVCCQKTLV